MRILVSGAAGNVGRTVTETLLADQHLVHALTQPDHPEQVDTLRGLEADSNRLAITPLELTDRQAVSRFVGEQPEGFEAAVLLAGGFQMDRLTETSESALDFMLQLNFKTAFFLAQALLPGMIAQKKGRLTLIAAQPAVDAVGATGLTSYTLSKTLVVKLAELLNAEGKPHGVVTTVIAPDMVDTMPNRQAMPGADFDKWIKPGEIAQLVRFACSQAVERVKDPVLRLYGA
jgi:NAD(P)-dependent dehydrogenase (short-subunit alcohol dehydrogenase family)